MLFRFLDFVFSTCLAFAIDIALAPRRPAPAAVRHEAHRPIQGVLVSLN